MSFVIVCYVPEGMVLAADSRLTHDYQQQEGDVRYLSKVIASDSNSKVFLLKDTFGLATFGAAEINGIPIAGYINRFKEANVRDSTQIAKIPQMLIDYFGKPFNNPRVSFFVAGYETENGISEQHVYHVDIAVGTTTKLNTPTNPYGANWGGETEVLSRIISQATLPTTNGNKVTFSNAPIIFNLFTLQDAIDFCIYAIRITKETFRFQRRPKTVGGPIDILLLQPGEGPRWVARKQYNANY